MPRVFYLVNICVSIVVHPLRHLRGTKRIMLGLLAFVLVGVSFGFLYKEVEKAQAVSNQVPEILPRSVWATPDDDTYVLNSWPPTEGNRFDVRRVILHDTGVSALNDDSLDPKQVIRSIFTTHAKGNRWGDIGYNYIIDRQGRIYQGRMGPNGTRGAHLYVNSTGDNFNYHSVGLTVLGRYGRGFSTMPAPAQESVIRLVAWIASVNGFDPNEVFSDQIWNFHSAGYTSQYTGSRFVDHGEVEAGNGDHQMLDMTYARNRATELKRYYDGLTYRTPEGRLVKIENGYRRYVPVANGEVVNISATQLELFPERNLLRQFPDQTLIRHSGGVAVVEDGKRRPIINPEVFVSRYRWEDVIDVTEEEWNQYRQGEVVKLRSGMVVRETNSGRVYIVSRGKKVYVPTPQLFIEMGYKWDNITVLPDGTLGTLADGGTLRRGKHPDGSLITAEGKGVEYLEDGRKRPIPTPEIFDKQFRWEDLVKISLEEWNSYSRGPAVYYPDGTIIREQNSPDVFVISDGKRRKVVSPEVFEKMGYNWNNIIVVSDGSSAGMTRGANIDSSYIRELDN
jgi:hypothetical protein